ncbi:glycoside hydrolase family 127 protein [Actinospica sp. MGRD01-02]|uniref:Glycoside hydrolase family 127 protein n=1 Tax=Actinospica acidithermotolerans TaxID=2828514 RepID=A0A941EC29_9ACTN|nr:RICIN domain-containing protein [Actinospica acidithermotolerans]MBR7828781.1 glycoside hydrolase family 127 protein [Actinospica acidithermotolerans]
MAFSRRSLLRGGALTAAALFAGPVPRASAASARVAPAPGGLYSPNAAPLAPTAFLRLPPGAVTPSGWLAGQLQLQLDGLCGKYQDVSHFLDKSATGWLNPAQAGWEEVPYWLRGYGDLGYVTRDATTLSDTASWIEGILATQASDGFLGPTGLRTSLGGGPDFWPYLPLLQALRSHQEYTGDQGLLTAMTGFCRYMNAQPGSVFSSSWISYRIADGLDVLFWLYNRTGEAFLLTLADTMHANGANWLGDLPTPHNVNLAQGFREPAVYAQRSGQSAMTQDTYTDYASIMGVYGQFPGGGFAGDENCRPGYTDPRQGFETCGIVELMASHELLTRLTGDPVWADRCEQLAFNMLPAALDPWGKGTHYVTSANSVDLSNTPKTQGQFSDTFALQAYMPGVDQYRCCPHNYGQGWPYFTEELWLATPDNGLCAAMYAPCSVTAKVGSAAAPITITEDTGYPFTDTVTLTVSLSAPATFPLYLRVPGWCASPSIKVNGQSVSAPAGPAYTSVTRTWSNGDTVTVQLPSTPVVTTWAGNSSVSVSNGALDYSLQIGENYVQFAGDTEFPEYEVHATTPWNYALDLPSSNPAGALEFHGATGSIPASPFTQQTVPVSITAPAAQLAAWTADDQSTVTPLEPGPFAASSTTNVTLIPMGAARLRITAFPAASSSGGAWSVPGGWFRLRNVNSGLVMGVSGMSWDDSAQVVQFDDNGTADHLWQFIDNGDGNVRIRNANSGLVLGVSAMSTADSADVVQFADSGTLDHVWTLIDNGDGSMRIRNANSAKVLGVANMSTSDSALVVQFDDNGTADHLWTLIPDGPVRIMNRNSGLVLGVANMSTLDSADVVQFDDNGTADHLWTFESDPSGWWKVRNLNSGKVMGVSGMSTLDSAAVVQFDDNGTADHLWRLLPGGGPWLRIQNRNSGLVLGVANMSTADSAQIVQYADSGTADHLWRIL